jgi:hypothetical protein
MNTQTTVTNDLTRFGYRELDMAGDLLKAYANSPLDELRDGVQVWFNANSGNVFLSDEDYNTAMMNGDKLELWYYCTECGEEGFAADFNQDPIHEVKDGYVDHK